MSTFGQDLSQSAREALAIANGEAEQSPVMPPLVDVAAICKKTRPSQYRFARRSGFSRSAVRYWEQRRRTPDPAARTMAANRALRVG